jgi:O-acetyl-ADP-ribose deacetylase (regulator of RNase III)
VNTLLAETTLQTGCRFQLVKGDITLESTDAIVNAANELLQHGGGVARTIAERGGAVIQEQSDAWVRLHGPVSCRHPAWTEAGNLPSRHVIHTVGPVWHEEMMPEAIESCEADLADAIRGSLQLAGLLGAASIALPAISTGIFGFPADRAARIIYQTILDYPKSKPMTRLTTIRVVVFNPDTLEGFLACWHDHFGP